jgi:hypothetical protein
MAILPLLRGCDASALVQKVYLEEQAIAGYRLIYNEHKSDAFLKEPNYMKQGFL